MCDSSVTAGCIVGKNLDAAWQLPSGTSVCGKTGRLERFAIRLTIFGVREMGGALTKRELSEARGKPRLNLFAEWSSNCLGRPGTARLSVYEYRDRPANPVLAPWSASGPPTALFFAHPTGPRARKRQWHCGAPSVAKGCRLSQLALGHGAQENAAVHERQLVEECLAVCGKDDAGGVTPDAGPLREIPGVVTTQDTVFEPDTRHRPLRGGVVELKQHPCWPSPARAIGDLFRILIAASSGAAATPAA